VPENKFWVEIVNSPSRVSFVIYSSVVEIMPEVISKRPKR
jgi:hypothetical protein